MLLLVSLCTVLSLGAPLTSGQVIPSFLRWGYCSDVKPQADFDSHKFGGTWFTLERIPNVYVPTDSCIYTNYSVKGDTFQVTEFGRNADGKEIQLDSILKSNGVNEPFTVQSEGVPEAPLKVLATDYDEYACLQSCLQYSILKAEFAWVLTKRPRSSGTAIKTCREVYQKALQLSASQLKKVSQGRGCTYPDWAAEGAEANTAKKRSIVFKINKRT